MHAKVTYQTSDGRLDQGGLNCFIRITNNYGLLRNAAKEP